MAEITKTLLLTGEEEIVTAGILAIAKQSGWTEMVADPNDVGEIPNPVTAEEVVLNVTKEFYRGLVTQYNTTQAIKAAEEAALAQSIAALDMITLTLGE